MHKDRAKMEQIDKDTTFLLQKARSKVERETKGIRECKEKTKKRDALQCWNMVIKKKQGKNESNVRVKRRKKEAEITGNEDSKSIEEAVEEWQKALDECKSVIIIIKRRVIMNC